MYSNTLVLMFRWPYFRGVVNVLKNTRMHSSTVKPIVLSNKIKDPDLKSTDTINDQENTDIASEKRKSNGVKSSLVAAAFAPLKERAIKRVDSVDDAIDKAMTPEQLLNIVDICKVNRRHALKIVSILAEWSVTGDADMKVFEKDPRFTSLCQTLGRPHMPSVTKKTSSVTSNDLAMVLNVKNDDEASKIITSFTLQQMIKVLSSLAMKKRRSVPLLRSLSFNISQNNNKLDVKQGADILYALATLNYPDELLLEKVSEELNACIPVCKKTSVIGSISTSLGILRYKDTDLLNNLCEWTANNLDLCRNQDLTSILITLAHVNHQPMTCDNFFQNIRRRLLEFDLSSTRLDIIWALTILNQATEEDFVSVLNDDYYNRLKSTFPDGLSISTKKKLLNINGAAKLTSGYEGPQIEINEELESLSSRSKEKQVLVTSVFEALSNLLPSSIYLRTNVNLNMGFNMDGECLLDSKMTPLPLVDRKTGKPISDSKRGIKVGILIWDYHEHTKGRVGLCGVPSLCQKLASANGYRVLSVPYIDFNPKDKLTHRIKYLEKKLKQLVTRS